MIPWVAWMETFVGDDDMGVVSAKIERSESTFRRWRSLEKPPSSMIIDLSVAYGADVLVGLIVSGWISMAYVESGVEGRLMHVPTVFMTNELARRSTEETITSPVNPDWE